MDHSSISIKNDNDEILLEKNSNRFVLFPIKYNNIYVVHLINHNISIFYNSLQN